MTFPPRRPLSVASDNLILGEEAEPKPAPRQLHVAATPEILFVCAR